MLFWCADVTFHATTCADTRLRSTCCWALADYLFCLDQAADVMSPDFRDRAEYAARTFAATYQELAAISLGRGIPLWKVRPKGHYFVHLYEAATASGRNPISHHCFGEESFIGSVVRIASACHGATVMLRSLQRYSIYISGRFFKNNFASRCQLPAHGGNNITGGAK